MNLQMILNQGFKIQSLSKVESGWYLKGSLINPENGALVQSVINLDDDFNVHSEFQNLPSIITEENDEVFFEWYNHGVFVKCGKNPTIVSPSPIFLESEEDWESNGLAIDNNGVLYCSICEEDIPCSCEMKKNDQGFSKEELDDCYKEHEQFQENEILDLQGLEKIDGVVCCKQCKESELPCSCEKEFRPSNCEGCFCGACASQG